MFGSVLSLRSGERQPAWIAFAFLTVLVASHTLLETARDALFLAHLPAEQLPVVYLVIAGLSLTIARTEARLARFMPPRRAMLLWTGLAALGTGAFWVWLPGRREAPDPSTPLALYGLYVWTGVIAALVLLHFWSLLAEALSLTQAKRLYPLIGSGSVVGALLGSALASLLARFFGAERLLLAAAVGFTLSVIGASLLLRFVFSSGALAGVAGPVPHADPVLDVQPAAHGGSGDGGLARDVRLAARDPYVRRVALLLLGSAACLTVLDFLFKSTIASRVPASQLGTFFGGVALGFNLLSLLCQLLLAPFLLRRFDLRVALGALPALLVLAGLGLVAGLGLPAALFGKASDGSLRYSLHRTATELLYVPLPDRARPRVKALLDVVGQRTGQALASLVILGLGVIAPSSPWLAALLSLLALGWLALAIDLRRHYVALLRGQLRERDVPHGFPELDVASLETLLAALDSRNDSEVLAALDVLEREKKARLVPALILHHPSEAVVLRALGLFARSQRQHAVHAIDRLFGHASVRVRCDAIAARSLLAPDLPLLRAHLERESSPEVRATISVHLIAGGAFDGEAARRHLDELLAHGSPEVRSALATAIAWRADRTFDDVILKLSAADEVEVRLAAIRAMTQSPSAVHLDALVRALGSERTRGPARRALVVHGPDGFAAAKRALADADLTPAQRWELPRLIASFETPEAQATLLVQLTEEPDGMVRYRIIRALETLALRRPDFQLDRRRLKQVVEATVSRAYRHLDERLTLERGAESEPERRTSGHALLVAMLTDKQRNAVGRLLRLLGLAHPAADFASIRQTLRSAEAKTRATGVELVGNLLEQPLRSAVLGLIDDMPDPQRLAAAGPFHRGLRLEYDALLERMLTRESPAVQDFTAYHLAELGLARFQPLIAALLEKEPERGDLVRALAQLDPERRVDPELVHAD
ncbi:MAG: Npt1/Npt2 family nucleotide transporter [Polyangiales bacterium]